jgi:predicted enzyme related to lactoylglutathione lyase
MKALEVKSIILGMLLMLGIGIAFGFSKKENTTSNKKNRTENSTLPVDTTTPTVTGIGGIFFYSDDLKQSQAWYTKNLGIEFNAWGSSSFEFRNVNKPDYIGSLQWKPFKREEDYFSPSKKDFMIDYRVQNLEGMVEKFKENGVTILDTMATYDFGKFIHIMDAEGNKIELWEPVDHKATK